MLAQQAGKLLCLANGHCVSTSPETQEGQVMDTCAGVSALDGALSPTTSLFAYSYYDL